LVQIGPHDDASFCPSTAPDLEVAE